MTESEVIAEQIQKLRWKQRELEEKEYQEKIAAAPSMIGKTFMYRNCYSCPSSPADYWWTYLMVRGESRGMLFITKVQKDSYGKWRYETDSIAAMILEPSGVGLGPGWQPCDFSEYENELAQMIDGIKTGKAWEK